MAEGKSKHNTKYLILNTDVLIIGGGGAGLRAAIEAAKNDVKVLIVIKEPFGEAHTSMAAGGLNVAIKPPATPKQHYEDTIKGGWHINNHKLVKIFSEEMPDRIYDLESYGVKFDRLPDGSFYTWAGGKQSAPLNLCAGDYTGREMMQGLKAEILRLKIPSLSNHFVTRLLTNNKRVIGAFAINQKIDADRRHAELGSAPHGIPKQVRDDNTRYKVILAKATIVATGGAGQLYEITTNAPSNTGEGYAWGLDVGAQMIDMEFVQFHPTGMVYPDAMRGALVTEKVRGHGGKLINNKGERFMESYQPERLELAGRDEVARAIYQEIQEGRGTKHGGVYLDVTNWKEGDVEKLIPEVFQNHMKVGIDIRKQKMEIAPSMHHMMGGFKIDEWGQTTVEGLFACGEVTASIHGANRLGGNSLAEGQVFGRRTGMKAAQYASLARRRLARLNDGEVKKEINRIESLRKEKNGVKPPVLLKKLKNLMWDYAGIIRDEKGLKKGLKELKKLLVESKRLSCSGKKELQAGLELLEMLNVAEMVLVAALTRKESRGAHYRSDYPKMGEKWEKNIILKKKSGGITSKISPVEKQHF